MRQGFTSYKDGTLEDLLTEMQAELSTLPKQEAKVVQFILLNVDSLSFETGRTIAEKAGVSEVTVGRALRRFGCGSVKAFKTLLQRRYSVAGGMVSARGELSPLWREKLDAEQAALKSIYEQRESAAFEVAKTRLSTAREVYVTGFQTVRGLAEDAARRLSLARSGVRYLSAHDGMTAEWINDPSPSKTCLLLVDVVPYSKESETLAAMAREQGRGVVVVADEYCHWAAEQANAVIYAPSSTGLFLESTVGLNAALALLVDAVASEDQASSAIRLKDWKDRSRRLKIF